VSHHACRLGEAELAQVEPEAPTPTDQPKTCPQHHGRPEGEHGEPGNVVAERPRHLVAPGKAHRDDRQPQRRDDGAEDPGPEQHDAEQHDDPPDQLAQPETARHVLHDAHGHTELPIRFGIVT
jgi:hypothetical protein